VEGGFIGGREMKFKFLRDFSKFFKIKRLKTVSFKFKRLVDMLLTVHRGSIKTRHINSDRPSQWQAAARTVDIAQGRPVSHVTC
jgi:hypothetical protein